MSQGKPRVDLFNVYMHPYYNSMTGVLGEGHPSFAAGTPVTTSEILKRFEEDGEQFVETRNTIYRIVGDK